MAAFDVELQKLLDTPTGAYRPVPLARAVADFHKTLRKKGFNRGMAEELTHLYFNSLLSAAEGAPPVTDDED